MTIFVLDASALAKHFIDEPGSAILDDLFTRARPGQLACLNIGLVETVSILVRAQNSGRVPADEITRSLAALSGAIEGDRFNIIPMANELVLGSDDFVRTHNINSTDAVLLNAALSIDAAAAQADRVVLVASDLRLLRAARIEGLICLNPETADQAEVDLHLE